MKYIKRFEHKDIKKWVDTLGKDADDAMTIGEGKPCGECNCVVEDCKCGCETCKAKQRHGQTFKKEPYSSDYSQEKKKAVIKK